MPQPLAYAGTPVSLLPVPHRVTFLLPYFPPDVAADGQLFALLARELAKRHHSVRVLTYKPRYQGVGNEVSPDDAIEGAKISRWWAPATGKGLIGRAFAAWWLMASGFWRALFSRGTLIVPSSPPGLALGPWWLSWLGRRYIYVLHDIHPELGIALKRMRPGLVASTVNLINRLAMRRAWAVVTLTEGMKEHALKLQSRADVRVIPNWVDLEAIQPVAKRDSRFAQENGLVEPFVIQYSGNLGLLHPLEGLTKAVGLMPRVVLTFIGRGARLESLRSLVAREDITNVRFFDYRPLVQLGDSLGASDIAVIALEPGADKLAMPSKLQGILASGRAILCLAPAASELARLVEFERVGIVVNDPLNVQAIHLAIEQLQDPALRAEMGSCARAIAVARYSTKTAADEYEWLL